MTRDGWIVVCLGYIIGLLSTNLFAVSVSGMTVKQLSIAVALIVGIISISAITCQKLRIPLRVWYVAAIVGILAVGYFQLRLPQPKIDDVVYQVPIESEVVIVRGKVINEPQLNSSNKLKFWLQASQVNDRKVSGKLYTTVSLLQGTGIDLGEEIKLKGILYRPQSAAVAGGFDFQIYLAHRGIFAGIQGVEVVEYSNAEPIWGWWKLRRRIARSHLRGLGSPKGQLLSSMVLGRKAVDLPVDIRDRFIKAGLAHVLAASGFHVSLLLGLVLKLTSSLPAKTRSLTGGTTLLIYLGLTGIQASVLRACLMGSAVLLAMALETKVKPLGSLLLVATLILIFNPLLIADLGFQLSFLATFGLIATMPALQAKLDWLPPTIASLIAVPLAASIWVLPLLCYQFNVVATYSIIVNILCTPLIAAISLGGMISAIFGLIFPAMGSAIAWLLSYPMTILIAVINFFVDLPGNSWAIGQISLSVLLIIYGLLIAVWLKPAWGKRWKLMLLFVLTLIILPISYRHFNLTQITILPTKLEPVIVIRDRGKTILINNDSPKTFQYTVLPFLTQQGINRLDYYLNLDRNPKIELTDIGDRIPIKKEIDLGGKIETLSLTISYLYNSILKIETSQATWLVISTQTRDALPKLIEIISQNNLTQNLTYLISSDPYPELLQLDSQTIITYNPVILNTQANINRPNFHSLKQSGAIAWTPKLGLHPTQKNQFNSIF